MVLDQLAKRGINSICASLLVSFGAVTGGACDDASIRSEPENLEAVGDDEHAVSVGPTAALFENAPRELKHFLSAVMAAVLLDVVLTKAVEVAEAFVLGGSQSHLSKMFAARAERSTPTRLANVKGGHRRVMAEAPLSRFQRGWLSAMLADVADNGALNMSRVARKLGKAPSTASRIELAIRNALSRTLEFGWFDGRSPITRAQG